MIITSSTASTPHKLFSLCWVPPNPDTTYIQGEIAELEQKLLPMSKARPVWPASISAARAAGWPRLAGARGSLRHDLALREASGEPAGRSLCRLVFDADWA